VVWFGTEVSTADAVLAFPGTPDDILELVARFETPYLVRVVPAGGEGDLTVDETPVVEPRSRAETADEIVVVAYDDMDKRGSTPSRTMLFAWSSTRRSCLGGRISRRLR
jgi:hypothetical protein